jgi:hypothetical protein
MGCAEFPQLDTAVGPEALRAPYPRLLPASELARFGTPAGPDFAAGLDARVAALRARARILSQPIRSESDLEAIRERLRGVR